MSKVLKWILIVLGVIVIGVGGIFLFLKLRPKTVEEVKQPIKVLAARFATYKEYQVKVTPSVKPYQVESNLSNVTNQDNFHFSAAAKDLLIKNAFVVSPGVSKEYFQLYEDNRYAYIPNFITTDSMLHNYHLVFNYTLKNLETEKFAPELKNLNQKLLKTAQEQYNSLKGSDWENAALRNLGFFAVGSQLLDSSAQIPSPVKSEVEKELKLIEAHGDITESPVMNIGSQPNSLEALKEDYSQYVPRGHYTKTDLLKAYFKTMMWYGRLTFRLKNDDEVRSAILISFTLAKSDTDLESWEKIYLPINFFVGKSDDITYYDFKAILDNVYGTDINLEGFKDQNKFSEFVKEAQKLAPPQINSMPIFNAQIQSDREKEIKGFRFMGQRFTIDASIFQRLVYREVGDKTSTCQTDPEKWIPDQSRRLPKSLDIPAAFGSKEAYSILDQKGETKYACYVENMTKMKKYISSLDTDTWTQNLYWAWLYNLKPLLTDKDKGFPSFMANTAWVRKELTTLLGSWTELKHDTILYAKQVYSEMGGGEPEEKDDRGYVEPNPWVYARLASLIKMTNEGLESRGLLSASNKTNLEKMEKLALSLKTISEKELQEKALTDEEYNLIRYYGGDLEHFWIEAYKDEGATKDNIKTKLDENPAPLVADVATDPSGSVLEEGTGYVFDIYAVVPVDGKLRIAKGGVYSYYEFLQPLAERLTDEEWQKMLEEQKAPDLPDWTSVFIAK